MMMNPVLRRETKTTLRSWKMFAILTVYVAVVALGAILFLYGTMFSVRRCTGNAGKNSLYHIENWGESYGKHKKH